MAASTESIRNDFLQVIAIDKENLLPQMPSIGTPGRFPLKPVQGNVTSMKKQLVKKRASFATSSEISKPHRINKRRSIPVYVFRKKSQKNEKRRSVAPVIPEDSALSFETRKHLSTSNTCDREDIVGGKLKILGDANSLSNDKKRVLDSHNNVNDTESSAVKLEKEMDDFSERIVSQVLFDVARAEADKQNAVKVKEFAEIILQMNKERLQIERKLANFTKTSKKEVESEKVISRTDGKKVLELEKDISKKKNEIRRLRTELSQLQENSKHKHFEKELEGRKAEIKQLKTEINQLQQKLKEISGLKSELQKIREQNKNLNEIVFSCRKENTAQKATVAKLQKEVFLKESRIKVCSEESTKQISELKQQIMEKDVVIRDLRKAVSEDEINSRRHQQQCEVVEALVNRLEVVSELAEKFKLSAERKVKELTASLQESHKLLDSIDLELEQARSQALCYQQRNEELSIQVETLQSQVDVGKLEINWQQGVIASTEEALHKTRVELSMYQEHLEMVQCQQQEVNEFMLEEKRNLEEMTREYEQQLKLAQNQNGTLEMAIKAKSDHCMELQEELRYFRNLYQEKQEELDATQCQAHCLMLRQQTEMTEAMQELVEVWELLDSLLLQFKEQAQIKDDAPTDEPSDPGVNSPSLVQSVLEAVIQSEESSESVSKEETVALSIMEQISGIKEGLERLAVLGSGQAANQQAQELITELRQEKEQIYQELTAGVKKLTRELETSQNNEAGLQCQLNGKSAEISNLKVALSNALESLAQSEEEVERSWSQREELQLLKREHGRKCDAYRKLESEKEFVARQLAETLTRLDNLTAGSDGSAEALSDMPSKLLAEKHEIELKLMEVKEKFMDYRLRTESDINEYKLRASNNIFVLQGNLEKAEQEISRLDAVLERIRIILNKNQTNISSCPDLVKLKKFLDRD
ncbi:golgin subfamily A member 6-like protein 22 [Nematostella vectensis]|uniref:golgin subfamily A member 6-like protein 22 n=1 Tax=Nematostella vectensis TaxID=45351 RepID=UPI0020773B7D|nr:golgin subfamily A member 6-like protein 22 [Nematostella vectensis]